jgi:regulator of CtrA degradation
MRLTTRLMQVASWLLLQRAVNEGELTRAEASAEKRRIYLSRQQAAASADVMDELPPRLRELVELSLRLQARILNLDEQIYRTRGPRDGAVLPPSPVEGQIERLRAAFGAARVGSSAM